MQGIYGCLLCIHSLINVAQDPISLNLSEEFSDAGIDCITILLPFISYYHPTFT